MNSKQRDRLRAGFFVLPMLAGLLVFFSCHYIMLGRIAYPYQLEWIEGGNLQVVARILSGLPVYDMPDMEYVAPLYSPVYYYLSALVALITSPGIPALRLVSYIAALVTSGLAARSVWLITRSYLASILALLCWAVFFRFSNQWYDLGRVDSLWTCFLAATVYCLIGFRFAGNPLLLPMSALFFALAVFTKQTSLVLAPFLFMAALSWFGFRAAARTAMTCLLLLLLLGLLFQWHSEGMFFFYTMQMVQGHRFNPGLPVNFLYGDLFFATPVFLLLAIYFLLRYYPARRDFYAWFFLFAGFMLAGMLGRWYSGGFVNALMPLHHLWLVMGVSGYYFLVSSVFSAFSVFRCLLLGALTLLFLLNIAWGFVFPEGQIPTAADRDCGDRLVARLKAVEGNVCLPRNGYLGYLAGKSFCAHEAFVVDVMNSGNADVASELVEGVRQQILSGHYSVLVLDTQAQFFGYGLSFEQLPYTATDLDCPADSFYPIIAGQKPLHWLQYNGTGMVDLRAVNP